MEINELIEFLLTTIGGSFLKQCQPVVDGAKIFLAPKRADDIGPMCDFMQHCSKMISEVGCYFHLKRRIEINLI